MKSVSLVILAALTFTPFIHAQAAADQRFPTSPQPSLTPGALCVTPNEYRYPEKIPYCNRDVDGELKDQIVQRYDATFGYQIEKMGRRNFKIDHYIPLCMGGSNDETNLWPQHPSVYVITDPLEDILCRKMFEGKLKQVDAIRLIKQAKGNLSQAKSIIESVVAN
jgi:hypothetical protein